MDEFWIVSVLISGIILLAALQSGRTASSVCNVQSTMNGYRICRGTGLPDSDFCRHQVEKYSTSQAARRAAYAG